MWKKFATVAGLVSLPLSQAQQFPLQPTSYESFGLTAKCLEALNTVLDCSSRLMSHVKSESPRVDLLDADGIEEICTKRCRTSLSDLHTKIQNECDPIEDIFDHNLALYPATYIVDRYMYVYDISCYKHRWALISLAHTSSIDIRPSRETGNACDYVLSEWRNDTDSTPSECDDCILGPMQLEVNSPIGHTEARADEFKAVVSSCGAKGYAYTSPPPYVPSQTSTSSESPTVVPHDWSARRMSSDCATTYRVQEGDTCDSIAAAQEVPSRDLVEANDQLDGWCGGLEVGQDLCLPAKCKVHPLKPEDSCESLLKAYGAGQKSLSEWNPRLYIQCDSLNATVTGYICVGPPAINIKPLNASVAMTNNTRRHGHYNT
ncbi:LysM domain-containing protein [Colletotrichum chlorophyti]|uniref:LysM domain-containing protein n=1 Tax=Colletotrichum chlorophyti TaxID=708187 RepID=A0A1Q8RZ56_9PEZI|nr:LysM domain-containing protein [Colletotrichum chlorophyti]